MKRYLSFFLILILALGCRPDKKSEDLEKGEDPKVEEKDTINRGEGRFKEKDVAIEPQPTDKKTEVPPRNPFSALIPFPKKMVILKTINKDTVVFVPCVEGRASAVRILDGNTAQPKFEIVTPREIKQYLILKIESETGNLEFSLLRYYEKEGGHPSETDQVMLREIKKGVYAVKGTAFSNERGITMIADEKEISNYKIVRESCR